MNVVTKKVAFIFILIIITTLLYGFKDSFIKSSSPNNKLPNFKLQAIDNKTVFSSDYNKKPLCLIIMSSWCGACKQEAEIITGIYQEYKNKIDFLAIGINDSPQNLIQFAK